MNEIINTVLEEFSHLYSKTLLKQGALNVDALQQWPNFLILTYTKLENIERGGNG